MSLGCYIFNVVQGIAATRSREEAEEIIFYLAFVSVFV